MPNFILKCDRHACMCNSMPCPKALSINGLIVSDIMQKHII